MLSQAFNAAVFLVFFVLAVVDLHRADPLGPLTRRVWRFSLIYTSILCALMVLGVLVILAAMGMGDPAPWKRQFLTVSLFHILSVFVFLAATLTLREGAFERFFPLTALIQRRRRRMEKPEPASERAARRISSQVFEALAYLAGSLVFSYAWLSLAVRFTSVRIHPDLLRQLEEGGREEFVLTAFFLLMIAAPFAEEVVYRGYMLEKIARFAGARLSGTVSKVLAVVLVSAVWAVSHGGSIEPDWVKWVQIFGVGLFLGVARLRLGLEVAILIHLAFNLTGGLFAPPELVLP